MLNRNSFGLICACIGMFIVLQWYESQEARETKFPNFRLPMMEPRDHKFQREYDSSLEQRPVIINFWASWCNICKKEKPYLLGLATKYSPEDLGIIGVASYDELSRTIKSTVESRLTYPVLLDDTGNVAQSFRVTALPQTFLRMPDGTIKWHHKGALDQSSLKVLEQILKEVLDSDQRPVHAHK